MSDTTPAGAGTGSTTPVISVKPVLLAASDRGQDLQVRVSAPTTGRDLPVKTAQGLDKDAWPAARETLAATSDPLGRIDSKRPPSRWPAGPATGS